MARMNIAAPEMIVSPTAPVDPSRYFLAPDGISGRSLTESGRNIADIWACAIARCTHWEASFAGDASGAWTLGTRTFTQSYAGMISYTILAIPAVAGYADHPEVGLSNEVSLNLIENALAGGGGPIGFGTEDYGSGPSPHYDLNYSGGLMTLTGNPVIHGNAVYFPFVFDIQITDLADGDRNFSVGTLASGVEVGTLTIAVPNWRTGWGTVSVTMPLYRQSGYANYTSLSQTMDITLAPAADSYLKYGSGPANENPVWNGSGMALVDPLAME